MSITVIPKESLNSPFNNAVPCSVTDSLFAEHFGFTQEEVDNALEEYGLMDKREKVRYWYDGYQFGDQKDLYNPWSISNLVSRRRFRAYWANTASNEIVSYVIRNGSIDLKDQFLVLMQGGIVKDTIKEEVTYKTLPYNKGAVWGLLLSCGYIKCVNRNEEEAEDGLYSLAIVNHEVMKMMDDLFIQWFSMSGVDQAYEGFISSLRRCDEEGMQKTLSKLSLDMAGTFDTANEEGSKDPENFYHGFVLGLTAFLRKQFVITSNRESGHGRYDVVFEPMDKLLNYGIIMEFKVFNPKKEQDMEGTCARTLKQIEEKKYDVELLKHGVPKERIVKFGIGFMGKEVLVRKARS